MPCAARQVPPERLFPSEGTPGFRQRSFFNDRLHRPRLGTAYVYDRLMYGSVGRGSEEGRRLEREPGREKFNLGGPRCCLRTRGPRARIHFRRDAPRTAPSFYEPSRETSRKKEREKKDRQLEDSARDREKDEKEERRESSNFCPFARPLVSASRIRR